MNPPIVSYKRHRFPPQIIAYAVWLYSRFPLSLRHVEEMLLERGDCRFPRVGPQVGEEVRARPRSPLALQAANRDGIWYLRRRHHRCRQEAHAVARR
jgi:putative transposase